MFGVRQHYTDRAHIIGFSGVCKGGLLAGLGVVSQSVPTAVSAGSSDSENAGPALRVTTSY